MLNYYTEPNTDNVYYDIVAVNKDGAPKPFRYNDNRGIPIIKKANNYKVAVARFSVDTSGVPIMNFPSTEYSSYALNQTYRTPDNNYYSITIVDDLGVVYQSYLLHESFNDSDVNDLRIWTIDQFLQILNKAVVEACLNTNVNDNKVLYFVYDRDSAIIDIYFPEEFANLIATHKFYMNNNLWNLFNNFSHTKTNLDQGRDIKIDVYLCGENSGTNEVVHTRNSVVNTSTGANCIIVRGYYCTIYKLYQIRSIIFTTSQLPIRTEFFNSTRDFISTTTTDNDRILKSFEFALEDKSALHTRSLQTYTAVNFEWIDMLVSDDIKYIDIQAYYMDQHGHVEPLLLPPNSSSTMKLYFKKYDNQF